MIYIILICVFCTIVAAARIVRLTATYKPVAVSAEPIENPERNALEDELHELYYELDLLKRLADKQDLDTSADWLTESQIKQALRTEKSIHATLKKIRKLESKLEQLD